MTTKRLDDYVSDLTTGDENIRKTAAIRLGNYEDSLAISALKSALTDRSASVRFYAKKSLQKLEKVMGQAEIDRNIPFADADCENITLLNQLVEAGDLDGIRKLFKHQSGFVRASAVSSFLQLMGEYERIDPVLTNEIIELLTDEHSRVVANSIEVLGVLGHKPEDSILMKLLFHEDPRVKANVAIALFRFHSDNPDLRNMALARLKEILESDKPWVRQSGVYALKIIASPEAVDILQSALQDREKMIRDQVREALKEIADKNSKPKTPTTKKKTTVAPIIVTSTEQESPVASKSEEELVDLTPQPTTRAKTVIAVAPLPLDDEPIEWQKHARTAGMGCAGFLVLFVSVAVLHAFWDVTMGNDQAVKKETVVSTRESSQTTTTANKGKELPPQVVFTPEAEAKAKQAVQSAEAGLNELENLEFDKAIVKLQESLENAPGNQGIKTLLAMVYVEKSRSLYKKGRYEDALANLSSSKEIIATAPEAVLRAEIHLKSKEMDEAFAALNEALLIMPNDQESHYLMGHLLRKTGKAEESLPHLKKALEHDQSNFQYHLEYGRSLVAVNRNDEGVEHMIKATNLNPAPTTFAELARTARESGNPYFAIKAFRKILRVRPNNSAVINQYAGLLQETGMYFPAIDQYVKLLKKNPNDAEILYNIGLCYQGYGKVNRMKQYFSKAAKVKPDWFEPRYSLGSIAVFQKEWTPAKIHLSTAHKLKPDHAPTIILLATVYMETQQYSKVTNLLDKFLETNPEHREAHLICGQANAFQVKTAKAKQHFETFLKLEPLQSPRRREVMKFLDQTK